MWAGLPLQRPPFPASLCEGGGAKRRRERHARWTHTPLPWQSISGSGAVAGDNPFIRCDKKHLPRTCSRKVSILYMIWRARKWRNLGFSRLFCALFQLLGKVHRARGHGIPLWEFSANGAGGQSRPHLRSPIQSTCTQTKPRPIKRPPQAAAPPAAIFSIALSP